MDTREGMSLVRLMEEYPDDKAAEKQFIRWRWPDGIACPRCGDTNIQEDSPHRQMPFRCRGCKRFFSVKTGTVMQSSKLGYRTWLIAMQRMLANPKGTSSIQLHKDLGITQKTAWFLAHRIRESWADQKPVFSEVVEVDETFVGGLEKNKHPLKKDRSGSRGWATKVIVAGFRERSSGRFFAQQIPGTDRETITEFVHAHTDRDAVIYSDEFVGYDAIRRHRYVVKHGIKEFVVKGGIHTNGIESLWAAMKRSQKGTYIKWSRRHAPRYINECYGRLNMRGFGSLDQVCEVVRNMDGKRLTYRALVNSPIMFNNKRTRDNPWFPPGVKQRNMRKSSERLTSEEKKQIRELYTSVGRGYRTIARRFNVSPNAVRDVILGLDRAGPGRRLKK